MKVSILLAALILSMTNAEAKFFSRIDKYINIKTNEVIELSENDIDTEKDTATYYSYSERIRKTAKLADLSKSTTEEISGVRQMEFLLADNLDGQTICQVWHLFENGSAYVGCRTGKRMQNIGMPRPGTANGILSSVNHPSVVVEVDELNDFRSQDIAQLTEDTQQNVAGTTVRIEAVFANGEALIQKRGLNLLDTSGLLLKYSVEKVRLDQLKKIER